MKEEYHTKKEASQKRSPILWFLLYEISRLGKSRETESRLVATRVKGDQREVESVMGYTILWWGRHSNKSYCYLKVDNNGCTTLNILKNTEL
jgi:hypothetical protein